MEQDYIKYVRSFVGNSKVIMVVSGAIVFDKAGRILLQKRSDNGFWGFPGGFMCPGDSQERSLRRNWSNTELHGFILDIFWAPVRSGLW